MFRHRLNGKRSRRSSATQRAAHAVVDMLENRRLMSVSPLVAALQQGTVTPQQLAENGLVSMDWQGTQVYAQAGEWVVSFMRNQPTYSDEGDLISLNIEFVGPNVPSPEIQATLNGFGTGIQFVRYLGSKDFALLRADPALPFASVQQAASALPRFQTVEPNMANWSHTTTPNDPGFGMQWGLQDGADQDVDAPEAWDLAHGSSSVVVAVIDTGIDLGHPDLSANAWTNPLEVAGNGVDDDLNGYVDDIHGWDFVNNDGAPFDDNGHGTHVAGIIAATGNNAQGVAGVSWNARLMALKVLDSEGRGTVGGDIAAIEYATAMRNRGTNVRAINASYGSNGAPDIGQQNAITAAGNAGIMFVAAAGNGGPDGVGDNNDAAPTYPASYPMTSILSVTAIDRTGTITAFGNYGPATVDLAAPGGDILSTYPGGMYATGGGTSMAAPFVTGAVALAYSLKADVGLDTVRNAILGNVDLKPSLNGRTVSGGQLNLDRALRALAPASLTVIGDQNGNPFNDTIVVQSVGSPAYIEAIVNGVKQARVLASTVTSISVYGLAGNDTIKAAGVNIPVYISGGRGQDSITGGNGADTIYGGDDNDSISSGNGADIVYGNLGNDTVNGGLHNDDLKGGLGNDSLLGSDGNDSIYGGDGTDYISCGAGNDYAEGKGKADTMYGGTGGDTLHGGAGSDLIYGDDGDDWIYVHDGPVLYFNDTVYGGLGTDRAQWDAWDSVLADIALPYP